ncbi:major facilitator superfamily domain-containing protein [Desarmillaria tabescens]|uniref:Major facilitator superfamily domain-containing protein n=1 Tax=Armillaria tabescens TaxID=1929756 RepID=A0AA39K2Q8_ARMTA|nr:major facilitator superfamily domain-containing protein [Desarmillaria tabescens]KAK0452079.1 major facilitator superfamily domain-containing protein [Desarmillaria tabescens]
MTSTEEKIIVVSWAGDDDPENPKNWTNTQKWIVTGLISTSVMLSHMSSSMIAPAARDVAKDLGSTSPIFEPLLTSVFILAYGKAEPTTWNSLITLLPAFGFLYFVSIAHVLGRSRVVQLANSSIFSALLRKDPNTMWLCRFFAGISATIVGAPKRPSRGVALLAIPSLLGPVIGPIVGAWLVMNTTWKWIFWSTSIAAVFVQVGSFFWLKETLRTSYPGPKSKTSSLLYITRASELQDYITSHLGLAFMEEHKSPMQPRTSYIAASVPRYGTNWSSLSIESSLYYPAALLVTIGLLITDTSYFQGGVLQALYTGSFRILVGITVNWKAIQGYLIDTYTVRATPAHRGLSLLRSLGGFALPLCSSSLYENLGYGKGNTILADWALGIGILLQVLGCITQARVLILWFSGTILRRKSAMVIHE